MVNQVRKAFTLIEILIVVIILGILAAIVVPQFTSATEEAQISNMQSTLQTIRNQIELYRVRNNGQRPDVVFAAGGWGDPAGLTPAEQGLRGVDYLRSDPVNPRTAFLQGLSNWGSLIIAGGTPSATDNAGFLWDGAEMYGARFDEDGIISGQQGTAQWLD